MSQRVLQFKITLQKIQPLIWRRIQVPSRYTFWDLHVAIQDAMGWTDSHLHQFTVINPATSKKEYIGIPEDDYDEMHNVLRGWDLKLQDYFQATKNQTVDYLYDFGDSWHHLIEFEGEQEKQFTQYPKCLAGERACPPEDVGGVPGYERFLSIVKDQKHEEHLESLNWAEGKFDSEIFEPKKVHFDNPKKRWKIAFTDVRF